MHRRLPRRAAAQQHRSLKTYPACRLARSAGARVAGLVLQQVLARFEQLIEQSTGVHFRLQNRGNRTIRPQPRSKVPRPSLRVCFRMLLPHWPLAAFVKIDIHSANR